MHHKRLEQRILKSVHKASRDFGLIAPNDRILVALSGGKDSYGLIWALQRIQAAAPFDFSLVAFHLDQGQPGHDTSPIEGFMKGLGIPYEVEYQDTYSRVVEKTEEGKVYCALCSRFRRAILYKAGKRHGCNKVALGHHADDMIETVLLNMFYTGQLKGMPPRLVSDDGQMELIRPLAYCQESELEELAVQKGFPVVPCRLCGSQEAQRKAVKNLLTDLDARYPEMRIKNSILASLGNVRTTHLMDRALNPLYTGGHDLGSDGEAERAEEEPASPTRRLPILNAGA